MPGAFNALRDNFVTDGRVGGSGRGRFSSRWKWFRKNLLDKHWKKDIWKQPQFAGCHCHCHPRHGWREHKLSARKGVYLQLMDLILEDGKIVCGPCRFGCQLRKQQTWCNFLKRISEKFMNYLRRTYLDSLTVIKPWLFWPFWDGMKSDGSLPEPPMVSISCTEA